MSRRSTAPVTTALFQVALLAGGCARSLVAPDAIGEFADSTRAGYALAVVSVEPAAMATIDARLGSILVRVEVEYEQPDGARGTQLWVCLAKDGLTFLYSSCRNQPLLQPNGRTVGHAGIYYVNGAPAVRETRYILVFLGGENLVARRGLYEDELPLGRLASDLFASRRVEHLISWR